jgi:flagellar operon protein
MRRIEQRGLQIDQAQMERLQQAVGRAEAKGAKDSLILLDELALVVSIQNHTVVTAMDEGSQKEHVFTNIDSVVIAH